MDIQLSALWELVPIIVIVLVVSLGLLALAAIFGSSQAGVDDTRRDGLFPRRLERPRERLLGGVCSGVARYFGWRKGATRGAFVLGALLSGALGPALLYVLLWYVMPLDPAVPGREPSLDDAVLNDAGRG